MNGQQDQQAEALHSSLLQHLNDGEADMQRLMKKEAELYELQKQDASAIGSKRAFIVLALGMELPLTVLAVVNGFVLAKLTTSALNVPDDSPQEEKIQTLFVVGAIVLVLAVTVGVCFWIAFGNKDKTRKRQEQITALECECSDLRCAESLQFLPVEYRTGAVWFRLRKAVETNSGTMQSVLERYCQEQKCKQYARNAGDVALDVAGAVLEILDIFSA